MDDTLRERSDLKNLSGHPGTAARSMSTTWRWPGRLASATIVAGAAGGNRSPTPT